MPDRESRRRRIPDSFAIRLWFIGLATIALIHVALAVQVFRSDASRWIAAWYLLIVLVAAGALVKFWRWHRRIRRYRELVDAVQRQLPPDWRSESDG